MPSWSDFDEDGDLDVFIGAGPASQVRGRDFLYPNLLTESSQAVFERIIAGPVAEELRDGQILNWIDYDNDGDLDVYITNYGRSNGKMTNDLFRNDGDGNFTKITAGRIVTDRAVSMGQAWGDYDNAGDLDLFVAVCEGNLNRYYRNNDDGTLTRLLIGPLATDRACSWGAAAGDHDNAGDPDLFVANMGNFSGPGEPSFLYRNDSDNGNHRIKIKAVGTVSNKAAIGAKVKIRATINGQSIWQLREISSQHTVNGHNSLELHFGLGDATVVETLIIEWPSGMVDRLSPVEGNQFLVITEGDSSTSGDSQ